MREFGGYERVFERKRESDCKGEKWEREIPSWSWGNSFVSGINTNSLVSHNGEEEIFSQWTTHHQRLPYKSKSPRRLPHGPSTHLSAKLFSVVNHTQRNTSWIRTEEYRTCAHILWELNMQAHILYKLEKKNIELVHISHKNWICRHSWRGRGRDRKQGHPDARALLE